MSKVCWKQKNGELISVDDMDINHLRNAFKYLIKHHESIVDKTNEIVDKYNKLVKSKNKETESIINGDASNLFNETYRSDENYLNDLEITQDLMFNP